MPTPTSIKLNNGSFFDFADVNSSRFDVETVAHHLSKVERYAGMLSVPFSVAQHSVLVEKIVCYLIKNDPLSSAENAEIRLSALLHDSPEFVMGDMVHPLKKLMPEYRDKEREVEAHCANMLGYNIPLNIKIHHADKIARWIETLNFDSHFDPFNTTVHNDVFVPSTFTTMKLIPQTWKSAKGEFLRRYYDIEEELDKLGVHTGSRLNGVHL